MKNSTLAILATLLSPALPSLAQNWTVGVPAAFKWSELTLTGGSCYPSPDQNVTYGAPTVSGMQYVAIVDVAVPPGVNSLAPGGTTLDVGDTIPIFAGPPNSAYFPNGSGLLQLSFWVIGTPTTTGQFHPCTFNTLWLSNLLLCPEGLSKSVAASCIVQPGSVGVADIGPANNGIEMPNASNNWSFSIADPAVTSVEVFDVLGSRVANVRSGTVGLGGLPNGSYLVRLHGNGGTRTLRTVIHR